MNFVVYKKKKYIYIYIYIFLSKNKNAYASKIVENNYNLVHGHVKLE